MRQVYHDRRGGRVTDVPVIAERRRAVIGKWSWSRRRDHQTRVVRRPVRLTHFRRLCCHGLVPLWLGVGGLGSEDACRISGLPPGGLSLASHGLTRGRQYVRLGPAQGGDMRDRSRSDMKMTLATLRVLAVLVAG